MNIIKKYYLTISFSLIISGLFLIFGAVPETLYFNYYSIANGEVWRLFSAHLVHSDLEHLIWNLLAFIILSLLMEQQSRTMLLIALISGTIMIDYYLCFNTICVINYAGFSGVLNTLLVLTLFQQWQKNQDNDQLLVRLLPAIVYFSSLLKIILEIISQQLIFSHISWQALPEVHLIGFITGTVIAILSFMVKKESYMFWSNKIGL